MVEWPRMAFEGHIETIRLQEIRLISGGLDTGLSIVRPYSTTEPGG
jgi:hypothetical protein